MKRIQYKLAGLANLYDFNFKDKTFVGASKTMKSIKNLVPKTFRQYLKGMLFSTFLKSIAPMNKLMFYHLKTRHHVSH